MTDCKECERLKADYRLLSESYHELRDQLEQAKADAQWGRVLWDWLREMLPDAGVCLEFDTEDLMRLAQKHGRAQRVTYDPKVHGELDAEPGSEIWWWGDEPKSTVGPTQQAGG